MTMRKTLLLISAFCLLLSSFSLAMAQGGKSPLQPPPIILIVREDIKPGEMGAHEQEASKFIQVWTKANAQMSESMRDGRLAMSPVAGNENEVLYVSPYGSFADLENKAREMEKLATGTMKADFDALPDARLHAAQRDLIASFRPDYSYHSDEANAAAARYMAITIIRLKPGHESEYWEMVKKVANPAREKAGQKASFVVYQVRSGMANGTYYVFRPMNSLAELDALPITAVREAMSKDDREDADKVTDRSLMSSETYYYRYNPRLSLVAPRFIAADPAGADFWNPKPQMAAATTSSPAMRKVSTKRTPK